MQREYLYRKGKYVYFRHPVTKELTRLPDDETSTAFEEQYGPLLRAVKGSNDPKPERLAPILTNKKSRFEQASIGWFIEEYIGSDSKFGFQRLAENTKRNYLTCLDAMREHKLAHAPLHTLSPQVVDVYSGEIAKVHSPATADTHSTLLSNLWQFARTYECFQRGDKQNPTLGRIRHFEEDADGHLAWPVDVIDRFDGWAIAERPDLYRYRMGLHYTGQRGGDVVTMKWTDYDRGVIHVVQEKTGARVWVPAPKRLLAMLDGMPRISDYIFTNSRGQPYAHATSLSNALRLGLNALGFTDYTMHGLRKNAGCALAEAGCTAQQIMKILGHSSPRMAMFYCEQADAKKLARSAIDLLDAYHEKEDAERAEAKREQVAKRRRSIKTVA